MKNNQIIILGISVLTAGVIGFFGGTYYQKSKTPTFNRQMIGQGNFNSNRTGNNNRGGNMMFNRPISGTISVIDDKSMTVKMADGSSKIVIISGSTKINKTSEAGQTDLKTGTEIMLTGTTSNDGTMTAESIFIGGGLFQNIKN